MRLTVLLALCGLLAPAARAADVEFVRVWPRWRDTDSFKRISEYFGHGENTSGQVVRRTHPESRDGYYFLVRAKHPSASLDGARFVLRVITPYSPEPQTFTFPVGGPPGETVFELGLTGPDWRGGEGEHPVAWKLELVGGDGRSIVSAQSFLWAKP